MGREIPSFPIETHPLIHRALVISLVAAGIAATVILVNSLCASFHRRSSTRKPRPANTSSRPHPGVAQSAKKQKHESVRNYPSAILEENGDQEEGRSMEHEKAIIVELSPEVATHGPLPPTVQLPAAAPKRKLSLSLSNGLPEKIRTSRKERHDHHRKTSSAAAAEDSIWKKTIILGERCKVPSDDEEEGVAVLDENGQRHRYYHPRTPRSQPPSRTASFACRDDVSTSSSF